MSIRRPFMAALSIGILAGSLSAPKPALAVTLNWMLGLGTSTSFKHDSSTFTNQYAGSLQVTSLTGPGVPPYYPSSFAAYCVDLDHFARNPQTVSLFGVSTTTVQNARYLAWLYQNVHPTNGVQSAGLQVAIWEVEYDYSGLAGSVNLTSGHFLRSSTFDSVFSQAQTYLNTWSAAGNPTGDASFWQVTDSGHNGQDFIGPAVPEPGVLALLLAAGGGLGFTRIRYRRGRRGQEA